MKRSGNTFAWIALCLVAAAALLWGIGNIFVSPTQTAIDVIHHRTSVRNFTNEPVSKENLDAIVRAGMAAPTAGNKQPWAFVVVTDRKVLDALKNSIPHGRALETATAAIVTFGVESEALAGDAHEMWTQDCSAATENILLATDSLGLGGVWLGVYPIKDRMAGVRAALGTPEGITPFSIVAIGHVSGNVSPKDKYKSEKIHFERW